MAYSRIRLTHIRKRRRWTTNMAVTHRVMSIFVVVYLWIMLFTHKFWLYVSVWQRASTSLCCILQLWRHLRRSWESTASMVHHKELCDNYPALEIRLNSLLLQLYIITNPRSCIRSPSCQLLLLAIPVELQTQQTEPENWSQLSCGHPNKSGQTCYNQDC